GPWHLSPLRPFYRFDGSLQGGGRELGSEGGRTMHPTLCDNLHAQLTLLLDCDLSVSLARAQQRNLTTNVSGRGDENGFEMESRAFFGRVHDAFLAIA